MAADEVIGRTAAGLALIALIALLPVPFGDVSRSWTAPIGIQAPPPDSQWAEAGGAVDLRAVEQGFPGWLDAGAVAGLPQSIEPFAAAELPAGAGGGSETVLASIGAQFTNSLVPMLMNVSIMAPVAIAPRILTEIIALPPGPIVDALPAEAAPIDVGHLF